LAVIRLISALHLIAQSRTLCRVGQCLSLVYG
jgi:hypothetical protein